MPDTPFDRRFIDGRQEEASFPHGSRETRPALTLKPIVSHRWVSGPGLDRAPLIYHLISCFVGGTVRVHSQGEINLRTSF